MTNSIKILHKNMPQLAYFQPMSLQKLSIIKILQCKYVVLEICNHDDVTLLGIDCNLVYDTCDEDPYETINVYYNLFDLHKKSFVTKNDAFLLQKFRLNIFYYLKHILKFVSFWKPDENLRAIPSFDYYHFHPYFDPNPHVATYICRWGIYTCIKIFNNYFIIRLTTDYEKLLEKREIYFSCKRLYNFLKYKIK
jgi:hypothetical protein